MSEKLKIEEKILIKAGEEFIKENPFLSVGVSFALGYFLGYWKGKDIMQKTSEILFALASKEILKNLQEKEK
ncbi:MAG: hypothetical protein WHV67_05550 [Thermoanaerobaculia bacterium]